MAGADRVQMKDLFVRLLQTNNPVPFKAKFTGENREVLPFIFEIDKYVKINGLTDKGIQFRRVFNALEIHYQNLFMEDQDANAELTVDLLKSWLIKKFPPPPMKHEFLFKLKSIKMRKNEDPKLVFDKFKTILKRIDAATDYINTTRDQDARVRVVSNEQILDALTAIFIRNNNSSKFDNDGLINQKVVQFIYRKNPSKYDDWKTIFNDMEKQLIPTSFKSLREYQYVTYPTDLSDYDIYKKPSKLHENNGSNHKTTKKTTGKKRKRSQTFKGGNKKRKYNQYCGRCGRNNHPESECFATHDVFGNSINKPRPGNDRNVNNNTNNGNNQQNRGKKYCKRCRRTNHYTNECNASYYPDRTPINDGKFQSKRNRNNNNYKNNRNTKEFQTRKQNDELSNNELMALLSKRINNSDLNADQQFECMATLNALKDNMSARQDK